MTTLTLPVELLTLEDRVVSGTVTVEFEEGEFVEDVGLVLLSSPRALTGIKRAWLLPAALVNLRLARARGWESD